MYTSGSLYWISRALSTLNTGNTPFLSAITLRLSVTLSIHGPGVIFGKEIKHDLSSIGREIARIRDEYTRKVSVVVRHDLAFSTVLDSQPIWHDFIEEDLPM